MEEVGLSWILLSLGQAICFTSLPQIFVLTYSSSLAICNITVGLRILNRDFDNYFGAKNCTLQTVLGVHFRNPNLQTLWYNCNCKERDKTMKPAIIGIQDNNSLKKSMDYIIENRKGYQDKLKSLGQQQIDSFKLVGFINTGHTLKHETYSTTKLADSYYKEVYGICNWIYFRAKGIIKNII